MPVTVDGREYPTPAAAVLALCERLTAAEVGRLKLYELGALQRRMAGVVPGGAVGSKVADPVKG